MSETQDWRQKAYQKALAGDWRKNGSGRPFGCMCAGGMIAWAITGDPRDMYTATPSRDTTPNLAMREFIEVNVIGDYEEEIEECPHWTVADWNDAPERTLEDVQNAFKRLVDAQGTR